MTGERRLSSAYSRDAPAPFLDPQTHEWRGYFNFDVYGLKPYFAADSVCKSFGGGVSGLSLDYDGVRYSVSLSHKESGFEPRDSEDFELETVREFKIKVVESADGRDKPRQVVFTISPRWPNMETSEGSNSYDSTDYEGVSVKFNGTNLSPDAIRELLPLAAEVLDVNSRYFSAAVMDSSTIYAGERYVRIRRSKSDALHGSGGVFERVHEYVANEGKYRSITQDDGKIEGYYHNAELDSESMSVLINGHRFAKALKHYHPKRPRKDASDKTDPLYHPKFGVRLFKKKNRRDGRVGKSVPWSERDELIRELDELLLNMLSWAGLPTRADSSVYVSDWYFDADERERNLALFDDPTPDIVRSQDEMVVSNVSANPSLTESDFDALEIVADGGTPSVDEVAGQTNWSPRTVYRSLNRLEGVLRSDNGKIGFASDYVREKVRVIVSQAKDAATAGENDGRSEFSHWKSLFGVEVADREEARLKLRLGRLGEKDPKDALRDGLRAWIQSGRDETRFRMGKAEWVDSAGRPNFLMMADI